MKTKILLAMGLCAAIGLSAIQSTYADDKAHKEHKDGEHKEGHAKGEGKIPDTVEGIWGEIHEHHKELKKIVEGKKLDKVHETAFEIRDLAKALVPKASADKKKQVAGAVKNISKLAEDLDKSGDAGDQAATEANLKKLEGVIKVLEAQFGTKSAAGDHAVQYTCPMKKDSDVVSDKPGNCPKCGMEMVVKK